MRLIEYARKSKGWEERMADWEIFMFERPTVGGIVRNGRMRRTRGRTGKIHLVDLASDGRFVFTTGTDAGTDDEIRNCLGLSLKKADERLCPPGTIRVRNERQER